MNNATTVVTLINKSVVPAAKARLAAAYQRACDPETPAEELRLLADREYADTIKVHHAVISNPNVSDGTARYLLMKHSVWYSTHVKICFEIGCGFLANPALGFMLIEDPGLSWLPSNTLSHLSIVAWAMRDYPRYQDIASDLERYERAFTAIVQGRKQEKEEAA